MKKSDIVTGIIKILTHVQLAGGHTSFAIDERSSPIGDLQGFDSLNGVEATALISDAFGVRIPDANLFVDETGTKALTVSQVADNVCRILKEQGNNK